MRIGQVTCHRFFFAAGGPDALVQITHVLTQTAGPRAYMTGLSDMLLLETSTGPQLYTAGGAGGGILMRDLTRELRAGDSEPYSAGGGLDAPRQLVALTIDGAPALLSYGRYGNEIEGYWLRENGQIQSRFSLNLVGHHEGPGAVLALEMVEFSDRQLFVTASRQVEGLHVWLRDGQGSLRALEAGGDADVFRANDVFALGQARIGAQTYVLALSADNSLTSLTLGSQGRLTLAARIDTRDGLAIETATQLKMAEVAGQTYALVGASGSGSIAVVAVGSQGALRVTDQVNDDLGSRFGALGVLEVLEVAGQTYVAAGGGEDGLELMTLLPGGRLLSLGQIADDTEMALSNPAALAMLAREGGIDLFVGGGLPPGETDADMGLTQLRVELGEIGNTVQLGNNSVIYTGTNGRDQIVGGAGNDQLRGGAGRDILVDGAGADTLWGQAGADVFVFGTDGQADQIADFERGLDRMDLSGMGRFYTAEALNVTPTATGAEIRLGDERLTIVTSDRRPLQLQELDISDLRDLWHVTPMPQTPQDRLYEGTTGADLLEGRGGDDTLIGGDAGDILLGQAGNDWLNGEGWDESFDTSAARVFRLYQATLDRSPDLGGLYYWQDRLIRAPDSLTEVAGGFVGSREFQTIYGETGAAQFVALLYNNVLNRAADAAGLAYWTGLLNREERSRSEVVVGFSESREFINATEISATYVSRSGLQGGFADDVFRLYVTTLGRNPDLNGFLDWSDRLAGGLSFGTAVTGFVQSAEFQGRYGGLSDQEFVTLLYSNVLGRAPDAAGLSDWLNRLSTGQFDRDAVVEAFAQSAEFVRLSAEPCAAWMRAVGQGDALDGGTGENVLFGGVLSDQFVFRAGASARQTVVDLEPWDTLVFEGFGYGTAAEMRAHLRAQGDDTVFADQGVFVTLMGWAPGEISDGMIDI